MTQLEQALSQEVVSLSKEASSLRQQNELLRLKIQALEVVKAKLPSSQEEKQLHLNIESTQSVEAELEEPEPPAQVPLKKKTKRKKRLTVEEKFAHIPVEKTTEYIPHEVEKNPSLWEAIGEEACFELIVEPTRLYKHLIVRKKYRCKVDKAQPPIIAKPPIRFSSSYISSSLAIDIVLGKYLEHGALYRNEKRYLRLGADIPRQSQSDAVECLANWCRPLYEFIDKHTLKNDYLQIDETFIKYINGKSKGSGMGYYWAIYAPGAHIAVKWIKNRQHKNVDSLLSGFEGLLQSDGYAAYRHYAKAHSHIVLLACWAHTFRKFRDALTDEPQAAKVMMHLIGKLYKLEAQWDEKNIASSKRQSLRATESVPIAQDIKAKLDAYSGDLSIPNNTFRAAINYAAGQWDALLECLKHGQVKLDTNLLENQFRDAALGKKNWMFVGHPDAGEKGAIIYTLLSCCKLFRINPHAYLTDVLDKLIPQDHNPSEELLQSLLPQTWAQNNHDRLIKELPTL